MYTIETDQDVQDMARGAVFLGSGGGGDPYVGELYLRHQLSEGRQARIVKAAELPDDAFVVSIAGVGAPTVLVEHLVSTNTLMRLLEASEKYYGRKIDALISAEIGGANSMFPLSLGARSGIPVIDGDGMGRAFPHLEMTTFSVYGIKACPSVLMDDSGNFAHVHATTDRIAEDMVRSLCTSLGSMLYGSFYPMSGAQAKAYAVHDTISHTLEIGRRIRRARESQSDPVRDLLAFLDDPAQQRHAREIFSGRIVDIHHETRDGWHWGRALINSGRSEESEFSIEIQNEYLIARQGERTCHCSTAAFSAGKSERVTFDSARAIAQDEIVRIDTATAWIVARIIVLRDSTRPLTGYLFKCGCGPRRHPRLAA